MRWSKKLSILLILSASFQNILAEDIKSNYLNFLDLNKDFLPYIPEELKTNVFVEVRYDKSDLDLKKFEDYILKTETERFDRLNEIIFDDEYYTFLKVKIISSIKGKIDSEFNTLYNKIQLNNLIKSNNINDKNDSEKLGNLEKLKVRLSEIEKYKAFSIKPTLVTSQPKNNFFKLTIELTKIKEYIHGKILGTRADRVSIEDEFLAINTSKDIPEAIHNSLSKLVLDYTPQVLKITVNPGQAQLKLNESRETGVDNTWYWLANGDLNLSAKSEGYLTKNLLIKETDDHLNYQINLELIDQTEHIISFGQDAKIFDGMNFLGINTANIFIDKDERVFLFIKDNFEPYIRSLNGNNSSQITTLLKPEYNQSLELDERRDNMYWSLSLFGASIIYTFITDGLLFENINKLNLSSLLPSEKLKYYNEANTLFYMKNAGIVLALAFGVETIVGVVRYLQFADSLKLE